MRGLCNSFTSLCFLFLVGGGVTSLRTGDWGRGVKNVRTWGVFLLPFKVTYAPILKIDSFWKYSLCGSVEEFFDFMEKSCSILEKSCSCSMFHSWDIQYFVLNHSINFRAQSKDYALASYTVCYAPVVLSKLSRENVFIFNRQFCLNTLAKVSFSREANFHIFYS